MKAMKEEHKIAIVFKGTNAANITHKVKELQEAIANENWSMVEIYADDIEHILESITDEEIEKAASEYEYEFVKGKKFTSKESEEVLKQYANDDFVAGAKYLKSKL